MGANSRSTVGTATDVNALLRLVWSRLSTPTSGRRSTSASTCPTGCASSARARARCPAIDEDQLVDRDRSLNEGAITVPNFTPNTWYWRLFAEGGRLDPDKKLRDYSPEEWDWFMHQPATKVRAGGMNTNYEGPRRQGQAALPRQGDREQPEARQVLRRARRDLLGVSRLRRVASQRARADGNGGGHDDARGAVDADQRPRGWVRGLVDAPRLRCRPALVSLADLLGSLVEVGLGYLSLDRESGTLSGGEAQRVKMVRHLGSALTDITYVFDEPTIGLHPHDIGKLTDLLIRLRDKGNTVLVVEHKPAVIERADHVVDLGPARERGGGRSRSPATSRGCAPRPPSPASISTRSPPSGIRLVLPLGSSRSAGRGPTTSRTSMSTSRSGCSPSSPAWPGRARAR